MKKAIAIIFSGLMLLTIFLTSAPVFANSTNPESYPLMVGYCRIYGRVVTESSGQPLANVTVLMIETVLAKTNSTGNFSFILFNDEYYPLTFKKNWYMPVYKTISIPAGVTTYNMGIIIMTKIIDVQQSSQYQSLLSLLRYNLFNKISLFNMILQNIQTTTTSIPEETASYDVSPIAEESYSTDASTTDVTNIQTTIDTKTTTDTSIDTIENSSTDSSDSEQISINENIEITISRQSTLN